MRLPCRLRMKKVNEIDTTELQMYIEGQIQDYPATVLQALEIILNAPFLRDDKFLYQSRGLYELGQAEVRCSRAACPIHTA